MTKTCPVCLNEYGPDPRWRGNFKRSKVCGWDCAQVLKRHTPEKTIALFWSRVDKNGPNGCWLYMLGRDKWGYGDLRFKGKHIQAHRLSWMLLKGDPGKMDVLHKCNNPPCCNPDHLYLGTDVENTWDRVRAGTQNSILKAEQVREIKRLLAENPRHGIQAELARKFNISRTVIGKIKNGTLWGHVS